MTLKILKNESNTLVLTLSELANENLPNNWLFVFTREQNHEVIDSIYLTDTSAYPERFNEFVLIDPTDIDFPSSGDYQYDVYQMPNGGSTDVSLGEHVEIGKVRVFDESEVEPNPYDAQIVNKVYEH